MKFQVKNHDNNITYYTLNGHQDNYDEAGYPLLEDNHAESAMAKKVQQKLPDHISKDGIKRFDYFIKTYADKEPVNPVQKHSIGSKRTNSFVDSVCKSETRFTKVPHSIFQQYIDFLRTKNERILTLINREIK